MQKQRKSLNMNEADIYIKGSWLEKDIVNLSKEEIIKKHDKAIWDTIISTREQTLGRVRSELGIK